MTHAHDHNNGHHHHHDEDSPEFEYRKSVIWGGFTAVAFILVILFIIISLLNPFE